LFLPPFQLCSQDDELSFQEDAINVEAIACIGMNHFYADQPELSLRFYRRLLQVPLL
jgi:hypothetical protein